MRTAALLLFGIVLFSLPGIHAAETNAFDINALLNKAYEGYRVQAPTPPPPTRAAPETKSPSPDDDFWSTLKDDGEEWFWGAGANRAEPDWFWGEGARQPENTRETVDDWPSMPPPPPTPTKEDSTTETVRRMLVMVEETPRYKALVKDALSKWTLMGRPATNEDYDRILDNIRQLVAAEIRDGGNRKSWDEPDTGSVIYDLSPRYVPGIYSGRSWTGFSSWPFHHEEEETVWSNSGGTTGWYGAPEPWVIHVRPPVIQYETPSPYYANPWVFTAVRDEDGDLHHTWVNIWPRDRWVPRYSYPPSRTSLGLTWDSDSGTSSYADIRRPWGRIRHEDNDRDDGDTDGHHLRISLSFNSSTRLQPTWYTTPWYGIAPFSPYTPVWPATGYRLPDGYGSSPAFLGYSTYPYLDARLWDRFRVVRKGTSWTPGTALQQYPSTSTSTLRNAFVPRSSAPPWRLSSTYPSRVLRATRPVSSEKKDDEKNDSKRKVIVYVPSGTGRQLIVPESLGTPYYIYSREAWRNRETPHLFRIPPSYTSTTTRPYHPTRTATLPHHPTVTPTK